MHKSMWIIAGILVLIILGVGASIVFIRSGSPTPPSSSVSSSTPGLPQGGATGATVAQNGTAPSAPTYYVSATSGNDNWSGTLAAPNATNTDGPFKTLARAQAAARASSSIKTVTIRAGTYSVSSDFTFTASDTGETWISYKGEKAILDGAGTGYILAKAVSNLTIEGLVFENLAGNPGESGGTGLYFGGGGTNETIRWNTFDHCIYNCLMGVKIRDSVIDSNTFSNQSPGNRPGDNEHAYAAIKLWAGTSNVRITHNLFENLEAQGVNIANQSGNLPENNNIIDRNLMKNVDTNVHDAGAIYMVDRTHSSTGNQITNNVIENVGGTGSATAWTKAIYLDELMSNVLVSGNVCSGCGQYAVQFHGGDHNTIVNNIFDLSGGALIAGYTDVAWPAGGPNAGTFIGLGMGGNTVERNIIYSSGTMPSSLWRVYKAQVGDTIQTLPLVQNNLYYSASGASVPNAGKVIDANPSYANPGFTNPSAYDFSLPQNSPAYSLIGFKPLPTDQGPLPSPFSP